MSDLDCTEPPFDRFKRLERLGRDRSGRGSGGHVRHHLYVGREARSPASVLIKVTAKPGVVYEQNLTNEIAALTTINRELPDSPHFPMLREHGRLADGRVFLISSLFEEFPLATLVTAERLTDRIVGHLRTTIEIARVLVELHRLGIFHVDLNPMNILHRREKGQPVIRVVDFESSYEKARHEQGVFYNPPTTPGYSAPEVGRQPPDARSDVFSLGAVLYTLLAGYQWMSGDARTAVMADGELDPDLRTTLLGAVDPSPDRRVASMQAFHADLAGYLERIWPGRSWQPPVGSTGSTT